MFDINWLAVIVAAILPMVVGSLWYGPLFGKQWMQMIGYTEEDIRADFDPMKSYGGSMVGAVLTAIVLAVLIPLMDGPSAVGNSLLLVVLCWLGFYLPFGWQSVAFEKKSLGLYMMNMAYNLVTLSVMAIVIAIWP